jgi:oxygen-dependent protoporphyrinogen oxidase
MKPHVTIIGGGIAGLATTYYLDQLGGYACTLVESSSRLGGTIRTIREDGLLVEAGPDSLITMKPAGLELATSLGLEPEIIEPQSRQFFIYQAGRLRPVPAGFASLAPASPLDIFTSDLLSLQGKLRILTEPFRKQATQAGDESIRAFFERRLGKEFTRVLAEPLFAGIHAGQADQLSMRALLPQFLQMESKHGSIARAVKARSKPVPGKTRSVFVSLQRGMESLVEALTRQLSGVEIRLDTAANNIKTGEDGTYRVSLADATELVSQHVVIATHASNAADLVESLAPDAASPLRKIPYASTASVTLALETDDVSHPLQGTGCLVPGELQMTACTWSTSKWAGRAPDGKVLFRCFYGRYDDDNVLALDDDALVALAVSELARLLPLHGEPTHRWVHRWENAMPQYLVGHLDRIESIEKGLSAHAGLHLVGAAYRGVGIPDCVRQARELVESIARQTPPQ